MKNMNQNEVAAVAGGSACIAVGVVAVGVVAVGVVAVVSIATSAVLGYQSMQLREQLAALNTTNFDLQGKNSRLSNDLKNTKKDKTTQEHCVLGCLQTCGIK